MPPDRPAYSRATYAVSSPLTFVNFTRPFVIALPLWPLHSLILLSLLFSCIHSRFPSLPRCSSRSALLAGPRVCVLLEACPGRTTLLLLEQPPLLPVYTEAAGESGVEVVLATLPR